VGCQISGEIHDTEGPFPDASQTVESRGGDRRCQRLGGGEWRVLRRPVRGTIEGRRHLVSGLRASAARQLGSGRKCLRGAIQRNAVGVPTAFRVDIVLRTLRPH
jgi:hypothetical protein